MIRQKKLLMLAAAFLAAPALAQNPIICDRYTPDPAPYVHGDTLYLFVDHDADETLNGYFTMPDWLLYSTVDMVNWTYRGTPVTTETFKKWAKQGNDAWAAQCVERNGKWYWYCTATVANGGFPGVGVAVANNPAGPYKDAIGKPLVQGWYYIDPTVFIDDNNQAYLFWGNNGLWYAKLRSNMTGLQGNVIQVDTKNEAAFGPYKGYDDNGNPKTNYEEAPWLYKIGDTYYLEYAAGGVPEHWAYSTAEKITGPWTYRGKVMGQAEGSFTIHGGSVDFKGHSYMFYHNGKLPGGGGYKRATCVEEFTRNADGSIPTIKFTSKGVSPIATLDPFVRQEAETINQSSGILCDGGGDECYVTRITSSGYFKVRNVDFADGASTITVSVRSNRDGGTLYLRTGSKTGTAVATIKVPDTHGEWQELTTTVRSTLKGKKDIFFTFKGTGTGSLFDFDWWKCVPKAEEDAIEAPSAVGTTGETYSIAGVRLPAPKRGINIIRQADGKRTKRLAK